MKLAITLTVGVLTYAWMSSAIAQAALPRSLETCADVDTIVRNYSQWDVAQVERASDGGWNEAVIRAHRKPGSRGLSVRESDIDLFMKCWEQEFRKTGFAPHYDYQNGMSDAVRQLFPMTERVALGLTVLADRLLEMPDADLTDVLSTLEYRVMTVRLRDGGRDETAEAERARIGLKVVPRLRDQWWRCWELRAQESLDSIDFATYVCRGYSSATSVWLLGSMLGASDQERERAAATLAEMLEGSRDPKQRQIATLAASASIEHLVAHTELGLKALKDPDRGVRLMAVRLADAARLNEDGEPYNLEYRRALQDIARRDPDAEIRKEANRILQLEPYLGPG